MSNFKDINNKSNINNNKSYNKIFSEQGKKLMKQKENFTNRAQSTLINNNSVDSKKKHSFKETFEHKKQDNKLLHFPKLNDVNKNI